MTCKPRSKHRPSFARSWTKVDRQAHVFSQRFSDFSVFLPPAYVVRREGNSFTLFVCPHLGGVPGTPPGGTQWGYPGNPPTGYPGGYQVPPGGGTRGGGTQLGQHREYLLHSGRYASCVHAGGLSCSV